MKKTFAFAIAGLSFLPQTANAQNTDCNALARDLVVKNFVSSSSDYNKLLFLTSLTQMDYKSSSEALAHSGKVSVGPIKIGPGTWSKEKQDQLRSDLQKIVNIDQIRQSSASISMSSGDSNTAKVVSECVAANGGFFVRLKDIGKENAVAELMWRTYPGSNNSATVDSVTVVHGKIIGGSTYAKRGANLKDRLTQRITIERLDPKQDLAVIVNTSNAGSNEAYLPPAVLPPPPPPPIIRAAIDGNTVETGSGGRWDGDRNPGCQEHSERSCVKPQHGGKIVPSSGRPKIINQIGRTGTREPKETPDEYCVSFWANTGACQHPVSIKGVATATEEYTAEE